MAYIVLNISEQEKEEIINILDEYLSDLNMELADTDLMDFRTKLKSKKKLIQKFIDNLKNSELHVES